MTQELFADKNCKHDKGYIQVTTECPFYEPGNTVTGAIYLRLTESIRDVKGIELEFKGGLKQAFKRFWHEQEGEGEEAHMVEHEEKLKKSKKILSYKDFVCTLPEEVAEGDYVI